MTDETLERFNYHLEESYGHKRNYRLILLMGARSFLKYLRSAGVITAFVDESTTQEPELLISFCQWMRLQRGTCDATLYNYSRSIRDLLICLGDEPEMFDAAGLRHFVLEKSQKCGWAAAKTCITALRMFLRYLIAEGMCAAGLDAAIPTLAHWRLTSLPRYLQPDEVERIIISYDTNTAVGLRNHAILLLLARLALRAGDIIQLKLRDIDWKQAEIQVSGKGKRFTRLPMTQEVGNALVAYLVKGRPPTDSKALFVRAHAPFRSFASHCAISVMVRDAMRRAGVTCRSLGAAHLLRHSTATSMLRQGMSLQDIAGVLRHQSLETTQIYAKVDTAALKQIVQPWPEVLPC